MSKTAKKPAAAGSSVPSDDAPHAVDSVATVASVARLEAVAAVDAKHHADNPQAADGANDLVDGCRLAYSSVLVAPTRKDAQALLAHIFTQALTNNPAKSIGGILFYDEATSALVQVLEGPAASTRALFQVIKADPRHTSVKLLWDAPAAGARQYEGFGMQLGNDPASVLAAGDGDKQLLQLTYLSQMTDTTRDGAYKALKDILAVAIVTNTRLKIGGCLFLNPRTLQVCSSPYSPW